MSWLYLLGVVIAAIPLLAFVVWFAGPMDEIFSWLIEDTYVAPQPTSPHSGGFPESF